MAALGSSLGSSLAGCGFRPLNAPPAAGEADFAPELAAVQIGRLFGRTGQLLHQALERRLSARDRTRPAARYVLNVTPQSSFEIQGYRRDGTPSRIRMVMVAPWTLQTMSVPPRPVATGSARAIDSYNYLDNEFYASSVSSEAAERRLTEQVAEDIVLRLALSLRGTPPA